MTQKNFLNKMKSYSNDYWKKAIQLEIQQLVDYDAFHDKDPIKQMPSDYSKI